MTTPSSSELIIKSAKLKICISLVVREFNRIMLMSYSFLLGGSLNAVTRVLNHNKILNAANLLFFFLLKATLIQP